MKKFAMLKALALTAVVAAAPATAQVMLLSLGRPGIHRRAELHHAAPQDGGEK